MPSTLRPRVLAALGALAAVVLGPTVPAAAATPRTDTTVVLSDTDLDGGFGVYRDGVAVVRESATTTVSDLSLSRDGSRFVDVENDPSGQQVVVRDIGGAVVRVVGDSLGGSAPALSPDGNIVAFHSGHTIRVGRVSGGPTSPLSVAACCQALDTPLFLSDTLLLVRHSGSDRRGAYGVLSTSGVEGTIGGAGLSRDDRDIRVSPDSSLLAWAVTVPGASELQVAPFSLVDDVLTVGKAKTVASGTGFRAPTFSGDGATLTFVAGDNNGPGDLGRVPTDGSAAPVLTSTPADERTAVTGQVDHTAPGSAAADRPFELLSTRSGPSVGLTWHNAADGDLSGTVIVRRHAGDPDVTLPFVPAPATSFLDTGLVAGSDYTYSFLARDRSGNTAPEAPTRTMTAVGVEAVVDDPTSTGSTSTAFRVRFADVSVPSVHLHVEVVRGFASTWLADTTAATATYRGATPGDTYQFLVSAQDGYGNVGNATSTKTVVPLDQSVASFRGGPEVRRADAYLGTLRTLGRAGDQARLRVTGDRFQVIGERCPTCGIFDVYDATTLIATVDTRASRRTPRAVLFSRPFARIATHTFTVRARGTAHRPGVYLDGFAMRA